MNHWLLSLPQIQRQNSLEVLERYNARSRPFGLVLSETGLARLLQHRTETLRQTKRVEFGEGVLGKLIAAFCDSPYISQSDYEETLMELQEIFYTYKNECRDLVSDDELIGALRLIYHDIAGGSMEYLSGVDWETMVRIAKTSSVKGTDLCQPPLDGSFDGEEYGS